MLGVPRMCVVGAGLLVAASCGDNAGGSTDAGIDAITGGDASSCAPATATPPATCEEALVLSDGDRVSVDMTLTPHAPLLCRDVDDARVAWFSIDVPPGERFAAEAFTHRDRVFQWLANDCQEPSACIQRLPPSSLASSSAGLVWENEGTETSTMVLEVSSGDQIDCTPYEFEVRVGAPPVNATCDGALELVAGETVVADSRLSSPSADPVGCFPTEFPLFYRVTVPAGENLSLEGAGVLSTDCTGESCPAVGFSYSRYRNLTGAPVELIAATSGFGTRSLSATIAPTAANATCAGAIPLDSAVPLEYVPVFGALDVTAIPCYSGQLADALFYTVDVPARQSLVVAWGPSGTAIFETCAAPSCVALGAPGSNLTMPSYRNETDAARSVVLRVAHRSGVDEEPHQVDLALASTGAATCEAASPVPDGLTFHQLAANSVSDPLCGLSVYGRAFFQVEIPAGHWLRASTLYEAGLFATAVLEECGATTCSSATGTSPVSYPGVGMAVDTARTVTVMIANLRPSTELDVVRLQMEIYPVP